MIAPDYKKQGLTVIPPELKYVEVIAVTANSGADANTGEHSEDEGDKELPDTVTLLVTPEQSMILAELEADGDIHLSLVYRGEQKNAAEFVKAQETILEEIYAPEEETDGEAEQTGEPAETESSAQEETSESGTEESEVG